MSLLTRYKERLGENWPRVWRALKVYAVIIFLVTVFLAAFFFNRIFISIDSGHAGVLWWRFFRGTDLRYVYGEGFHVIFPWDRMTIYDLRIQQVPHNFTALSNDGLPIQVEVSIRYRPVGAELPMLHQNVGVDYVEKVVKPEVQAKVRFVLAQYTPEQIYTSEGFLLNIVIQGALGEMLERHILLDDLLIKRLTLPDPVRMAIESKLIQQQQLLEYKYRLEKEEKEADRRRIEAAGIRDFQLDVMKGGAFDQYLRYQGIGATLQLASSNNAKVVIVGGNGGLPLILNVPDTPLEGTALPGGDALRTALAPAGRPTAVEARTPPPPGSPAPAKK